MKRLALGAFTSIAIVWSVFVIAFDRAAGRAIESSGSQPTPDDFGGSGKRFEVDEIVIRKIEAHVEQSEEFGALDAVVPEVRLHDLGVGKSFGHGKTDE